MKFFGWFEFESANAGYTFDGRKECFIGSASLLDINFPSIVYML